MIARAQIGNPVQPLVLSGLRGVGKTVLLLRWRSLAIEAGWATAHIEARADADLRQQIGGAINDLLRQVSRHYRDQERVERLKRVATSFVKAAGATVSRGSLSFEVQPEPGVADSGTLETDLGELLVEVGQAARAQGSGAVILIDELQDAGSDKLSGLVGACHRINQQGLPALIVGAGLPTVGRVLSDAKFVWDTAVKSPITSSDVDAGSPEADDQLRRSVFVPRYDRATPAERRYMHAIASLGDDQIATADVARVLSRRPSDVSVQRDGLLNKGSVYAPERGLVAFTVPRMAAFLRSLPTHEFG